MLENMWQLLDKSTKLPVRTTWSRWLVIWLKLFKTVHSSQNLIKQRRSVFNWTLKVFKSFTLHITWFTIYYLIKYFFSWDNGITFSDIFWVDLSNDVIWRKKREKHKYEREILHWYPINKNFLRLSIRSKIWQ